MNDTIELARSWVAANKPSLRPLHVMPTKQRARVWGLPAGVERELRPFMRLGDGSAIALWNKRGLVLLGSEGELRFVARSLEAFDRALENRKTGLAELDGTDKDRPRHARETKALKKFVESTMPVATSSARKCADALRSVLRQRFKKRSDYWQEEFVITRVGPRAKVQWYDGGLRAYPGSTKEFEALLNALPQKRSKHEVVIDSDGTLFVDGNLEFKPKRR